MNCHFSLMFQNRAVPQSSFFFWFVFLSFFFKTTFIVAVVSLSSYPSVLSAPLQTLQSIAKGKYEKPALFSGPDAQWLQPWAPAVFGLFQSI